MNSLLSGQSSPGSLQSGQHPSKAILQIPQVSSWASQVHEATACHLYLTKGNEKIKDVLDLVAKQMKR